jgi:hypothetical protein
MPGTRSVVLLVALALMAGACTGSVQEGAVGLDAPPQEEIEGGTPASRPITKPDGLVITNAALGPSRVRVRTAIRDLRRVGLWRRLTDEHHAVRFGSRPGRDAIPEDGHLADAYLTAQIDGRRGGSLCDVMFFPAAIRDDLARWRTYHTRGLLADPAPTDREFWGAIMAHELAHCLDGGKGEPAAMRWERRALAALRTAELD